MSDVDDFLAACASDELVRPSALTPNIIDLGVAVANLAGASGITLSTNAEAMVRLIGEPDHLVLIMADGFGAELLQAMHRSFLSANLADTITSVFPTSTPVVLTSLATGLWPNQHGVTALNSYQPELGYVVNNLFYSRRSDGKQLSTLDADPDRLFPVAALVGRFQMDTAMLIPAPYQGGFFRYIAGGKTIGYESLDDAVDLVVDRVSKAEAPTYTHLYASDVDHAAHVHGFRSERYFEAALEVDRQVERLSSAMPNNARVVLTADHGFRGLDVGDAYDMSRSANLERLLIGEPWGSGRDTHFDVNINDTSKFEDAFRQLYGDAFYLFNREDVLRLELFGPGVPSPAAESRIGSHLAVSRGPAMLWHRMGKPRWTGPPGAHSGLSTSEMLISVFQSRQTLPSGWPA